MAAGVYNFIVQQGETFNITLQWTDITTQPVDLTEYTLEFIARSEPNAPELIKYTTPCEQLSITNPQEGQFEIFIPAGDTDTYTWNYGIYDLIATSPNGVVTQILKGSITITPLV